MFSKSIALFRANVGVFAVLISIYGIGKFCTEIFVIKNSYASTLFYIYIGHNIQVAILKDESLVRLFGYVPSFPGLLYILKCAFIFLFGLLLAALATYTVANLMPPLVSHKGSITGLLVVIFVVTMPLSLALFGTWLPADIMKREKSVGEALERGRKKLIKTYARYFVANTLSLALPILVSLLLGRIGNVVPTSSPAATLFELASAICVSATEVLSATPLFVLPAMLYRDAVFQPTPAQKAG
ncbi:hypothetical protein [Ciceribacter ferrooxidans]|uniref:Uncharacterized protein n=1 Tax=Ciceribacter ferrooxidans TaxID=2509717 RepID=A0A4Q2TF52_9HYPH|nr:hypothetical protein [Ciceribacter ferrooxidans]RYC17320.1 hypothetical protein EUU22_04825 [Ciceribacter ferrooxidans]